MAPLLTLAAHGVTASSEVAPCEDLPVEVEGEVAHVTAVCAVARQALERLAELDLVPARTIRVVLVEAPLLHGGESLYGRFDGGRDLLEVMSPGAVAGQQPPPRLFGLPIDDAMYGGLVVHEITHAVAQQRRRADRLGSPAQEYLAYAVQLASLPVSLRDDIVARAGVRGWEQGDSVSLVYLALDTHRFAVKSYLHLYGHPDRPAALDAVLASRGNRIFTAP